MMRIGVFGRGKLGSAVVALASKEKDIEVAWVVDLGEEPGAKVDAVLDASAAQAVGAHLDWALSTGTDIVIGATGWDRAILDPERIAKAGTGVLVSPNFSLSVAFMRRAAVALGRFAALDGGSSLAIVERHHSAKADAPSGTAKLLADALV
jgi:4-hydroxy-tetrahydrodipicolinate reductase